jgi:hypothetical protein
MRVTTRIASSVLAALLGVASLVALVELALAAVGRDPWLVDWRAAESFGQEHSWNDAAVRVTAIAMLAVGVVLLVAALRPRRPVVLDSDASTEHVQLQIRTRALEHLLDREIGRLDGITTTASRWNADIVSVRAAARRSQPVGVDEAVRSRATEVLTRLGVRPDGIRVHVRGASEPATSRRGADNPRGALEQHPPIAEDDPSLEHTGANP